jgi:hypothetical protein
MDYIKAVFQFLFLFFSNIVLVLLGFLVVAIAIPFRVKGHSVSDGREIVNLPKWAWLWGNDFDGLLGDKRGWWAANTPFGVAVDSYIAMYTWTALRNPANNKRLLSWYQTPVVGSVITYKGDYTVEDKPGMGGWQFVKTVHDGTASYGFYLVHEWSLTRAFVIRFGYKVKPSHAGSEELAKGFTTKVNLYKAI